MSTTPHGIRLLLLDVDGVLTDARLIYGADGEERKVFNAQDGHAMRVALAQGLGVGLVSGRALPAVEARAAELGLRPCLLGIKDKHAIVDQLLRTKGIPWSAVAFMGDDEPDGPCMRACGLSIAPADANPLIRRTAGHITRAAGGRGAVAEAVRFLIRGRSRRNDHADLHG